jgi:hypothetical protein
MAVLIANADGNLTGASTFAATEVGANAQALVRNSTATFAAASSSTSSSFTVTSGKVIDAVLLWLSAAAGVTGTFKVDLQKGGVSQASVTVNKSDLPDSTNAIPVPVLFKLSSTATGDGGSNWTIVVTTTGTGTVTYNRATSTTANFTRALRTTTAATPAAGDDLFVVGELTGAGTHNSRAVTMDSAAATAYGNGSVNSTTVAGGLIAVSNYGTLSYGTSAATNYILRAAADLNVYQYGTLNIGSSGAEIPRSSTAVLEFQLVSADGDFGLQCLDNSVVNIAGLSRTSGKNVVKCKLTADVASNGIATGAGSVTNGTGAVNSVGADGLSLFAVGFLENTTNATHGIVFLADNNTNTVTVWLARGSGTNNRYVRITMGDATVLSSVANGFYADIDLQAGTIGTATAIGTGTATSASIVPVGGGYVVKITGKISSGSPSIPRLLINACSAAGVTSYPGSNTQSFVWDHLAIVNTSSISDTTFNVDTDTGWLSGDAICVASTTRTASECEIYPINANAGASSLTSALYPFSISVSTHSGTSPTQAEVGLLTRNVKIRSTSSTLMTYVYITATAMFTASWAEFYYIGANTTKKRGIEIDDASSGTAGARSITYCSIHDCDVLGVYLNSGNSLNLTFSNNVLWNSKSGSFLTLSGSIVLGDYIFDNNLVMLAPSGHCFALADASGVVTNNTAVGAGSINGGFNISSGSIIGTFSGNTAHSCTAYGCIISASGLAGTVDALTAYRNNSYGVFLLADPAYDLVFNDLVLFGNRGSSSANFTLGGGDAVNITGNSVIAGDATFSTSYGVYNSSTWTLLQLNLSNVDMSGVGTGLAPHDTSDFLLANNSLMPIEGQLLNCKFGAPSLLAGNKAHWSKNSYLNIQRYNQTNGDHRTEMTYGQLKTDSVIYSTAAPSMRMTPNNASNKLASAPKRKGVLVPVASGAAASVSVKVRKSVSGDGAAYNGNQPRLIQRANPALGQNNDVVLATASGSAGSFETLSASTSVPTDDGCFELIVDCDGTAGWVNVDDWA